MYPRISACVKSVPVRPLVSALSNSRVASNTYSRAMSTLKQSNLKQWRFAPLDEASKSSSNGQVKLLGIVFDVDGTLCR